MNIDNYVVKSLELHLFFGRIMKEHALFLRAGFTPANMSFSNQAIQYQNEFERLLCKAVTLSDGIISNCVLSSGEIVTEFTAMAEKQTENFTGISINREITEKELKLTRNYQDADNASSRYQQVKHLNMVALRLLDGFISFKQIILRNVLECKMFTMNYPLLIEHITREAKLYRDYVRMLENDGYISDQTMKETECFWNQIMMEHAQFIRGLLDPSESELINTANDFAGEYSKLLKHCQHAHEQTMTADDSLETTIRFRDFKRAGTEGTLQCSIRSVILPLLADHVLRESNHYIRLLEC